MTHPHNGIIGNMIIFKKCQIRSPVTPLFITFFSTIPTWRPRPPQGMLVGGCIMYKLSYAFTAVLYSTKWYLETFTYAELLNSYWQLSLEVSARFIFDKDIPVNQSIWRTTIFNVIWNPIANGSLALQVPASPQRLTVLATANNIQMNVYTSVCDSVLTLTRCTERGKSFINR